MKFRLETLGNRTVKTGNCNVKTIERQITQSDDDIVLEIMSKEAVIQYFLFLSTNDEQLQVTIEDTNDTIIVNKSVTINLDDLPPKQAVRSGESLHTFNISDVVVLTILSK